MKGFVWFTPQLVGGTLPNKQQAEEIADDFFGYMYQIYTPTKLHWIKPHDEIIVITDKKQTITRMKVKIRPSILW